MCIISIIIPTFNRCAWLQKTLDSVYQQTSKQYEVLVIDDGSSDATALMLQQQYPQVSYYYQNNAGVSAARNKGLALAKGNWLAFLDSDDQWLPEKLEKQIEKLNSQPSYKVCHTEEIWLRNGVPVKQMKKHKKMAGWIFSQCLALCAMSPSSILIHRDVFEKIGVFDVSLPACEDYDLWLRITAQYPVLLIAQPQIIKNGGHEDQLSRKYWGMDRYRIQALQNIILGKTLDDSQKQAAIIMLKKKCSIFKNGALKRGNIASAELYQQIIDRF